MIVWGSGTKTASKKLPDSTLCQHCGHAGTSHVVATYGYSHLYWLFRASKKPDAAIHCEHCGATTEVAREDQKPLFASIGGTPVPAFDRFGGAAFLALVAVGVTFVVLSQADRGADGSIDRAGNLDAFSIRVGDCYNQRTADADDDSDEISSVSAVPCSDPHDNEVYAVFDVAVDEFPGSDGMYELAVSECVARFDDFVGTPYQDSILDVNPIYPTFEGWNQIGDREVICSVFHMEDERIEGTAAGLGI